MTRSVQQKIAIVTASYTLPYFRRISRFRMNVFSAFTIHSVTMPGLPSLYSPTKLRYDTLMGAFLGDVAASAAARAERTVLSVVLKSLGLRHDAFCATFSVMLMSPSLIHASRRVMHA